MSDMDRVTIARRIRKENAAVPFVFIAGHSDYIAVGCEAKAMHTLTRPLKAEKLFAVLDRAVDKPKQNNRYLNLELSGKVVRIPFYEIRSSHPSYKKMAHSSSRRKHVLCKAFHPEQTIFHSSCQRKIFMQSFFAPIFMTRYFPKLIGKFALTGSTG